MAAPTARATAPTAPQLPAYQPADRIDALLHAEITGADGVYSGNWHKALQAAAAQWAAEGATAPTGAAAGAQAVAE